MILRIDVNSMVGDRCVYSLTRSGIETRGERSATISMSAFLAQLGPVLRRLTAQRRRDQVRVHYAASCQPIYNVSIRLPGRLRARKFGVYGFPDPGAVLEDTQVPVDPDLVELFAYCLRSE